MFDISLGNYTIFMLVLIRMSGMIIFNPILSRKNIPTMLKGGLVLALTIVISSSMLGTKLEITSTIQFVYIALKELGIGWVYGFILQMFLSTILISGEIMDMQMGLGMSKIYDPSSNIQMPVTGSILNVLFILIFFASDSHLTLIKLFMMSYDVIPVGAGTFNLQIGAYITNLFSSVLVLALKLSLPIIAIEIIAEASMGVLMKAVPQINVFVVNIQIKVLVGFLVLLILISPMSSFIEGLVSSSFSNMSAALKIMAAS